MSERILIDSDVLVWFTRGHPAAVERLFQIDPWHISVVSYMELAQGCRNKTELTQIKKGLAAQGTQITQLSASISERAAKLVEGYALSHNLRLGDALIAATALELDCVLLTANIKHFSSIPGLKYEAFVIH